MSDEIPNESPAETADAHLTAAENFLAVAEDERAQLAESVPAADEATSVADSMRTGLMFSTACTLADLHRKMAETYWGYPPRRIETPGPACYPPADGWDGKSIVEPPCDCCASGLFANDTPYADTCADCGHGGEAHSDLSQQPETDPRDGLNGPGESALIEAARMTKGAGWRQVSEWLAACADANREGRHWPPLIGAPASVAMQGGAREPGVGWP